MARKKSEQSDSARRLAIEAARLAADRHGEDILILDLRGLSNVTDYFVIATGTSDRQLAAVSDQIEDLGKSLGQKLWHAAGRDSGGWIVMDFVDVVVHLFSRTLRTYYDLELIWGEAPRVEWQREKKK